MTKTKACSNCGGIPERFCPFCKIDVRDRMGKVLYSKKGPGCRACYGRGVFICPECEGKGYTLIEEIEVPELTTPMVNQVPKLVTPMAVVTAK